MATSMKSCFDAPLPPNFSAILECPMQRLPVLGQATPLPMPAPAPPLRSTELGAFKFGSKLERKIVQKVGQASTDYGLIEEGDRIMVCISGGKDSYALLDVLLLLQRKAPV